MTKHCGVAGSSGGWLRLMAAVSWLAATLFFQGRASASDTAQVDRLLDELERRLEKKEAGFMAPAEEDAFGDPTVAVPLDLQPSVIKAGLPGMEELTEMSTQLVEINRDIDTVSGEVMKATQDMIQSEDAFRHADISLALAPNLPYQLESLLVKLDGIEVFSVSQRDATLYSTRLLPVFVGPITQGNHEIAFELSLRDRSKGLGNYVRQAEKTLARQESFVIGGDREHRIQYEISAGANGLGALTLATGGDRNYRKLSPGGDHSPRQAAAGGVAGSDAVEPAVDASHTHESETDGSGDPGEPPPVKSSDSQDEAAH